jgi:hypothetical protein
MVWVFARCGCMCFFSEWRIISLSFLQPCHSPLLPASQKSRQSPEMTGHFWRQHLNRWWPALYRSLYIIGIFDNGREISTCTTSTWFLLHVEFVAPQKSFHIIKQYNMILRKCITKRPFFTLRFLALLSCLGQMESWWTRPHLSVGTVTRLKPGFHFLTGVRFCSSSQL